MIKIIGATFECRLCGWNLFDAPERLPDVCPECGWNPEDKEQGEEIDEQDDN